MTDVLDPVQAIEARRAARKAELAKQRQVQLAIDLEAIDAIEVELGDSAVAILDVPYSPGLPAVLAVRCPRSSELKRYQHRLKGKDPDTAAAAEEIGAVCIVYPPAGELRTALLDARPGLTVQAGTSALGLATGKARDEGKG